MKTSGKLAKRLTAGTVAVAAAFSLLVGGSFKEPAELLQNDNTPAIIEYEAPPEPKLTADEPDDGPQIAEEKKKSLRQWIKAQILKMPFVVRLLVCLPAWFVGWALIALGGAVWGTVLSPVASTLMHVLLTALVLLGLVVFSVKMAAPETPIKNIVNRRNICIVLICAVIGEASFVLLQLFWPEWDKFSDIIRSIIALALILFAALPAALRGRKIKN